MLLLQCRNAEHDVSVFVHGDGFIAAGRSEGRKHLSDTLKASYDIKEKTLRPEEEEVREVKILGRIITWTSDGLMMEPDPGQHELYWSNSVWTVRRLYLHLASRRSQACHQRS